MRYLGEVLILQGFVQDLYWRVVRFLKSCLVAKDSSNLRIAGFYWIFPQEYYFYDMFGQFCMEIFTDGYLHKIYSWID